MSIRTVLVSAGLLACCGIVSSRPQPVPPGGTGPATPPFTLPPVGFQPPNPYIPRPAPPPPRAERSFAELLTEKELAELLAELERVKALLAANRAAVPSQPQPVPFPNPGELLPAPVPPIPASPFQRPGPNVLPPAPTPEKTVDDLLTELERVKSLKADLEKREQELKATITKKLEKQTERLQKLGVAPKDAKEPDRVGRILIEGNTKTPDSKILDKLNLHPGTVLHYPALEKARTRLQKAGFKDATVEVIPNELDSTFKDIRVRVTEPEPKPAPAPVPLARG